MTTVSLTTATETRALPITATPLVVAVSEPTTLLSVPTVLVTEMRRQYEAGRASNFISPRYESWETFVTETVKDAVLGWPRPWFGE